MATPIGYQPAPGALDVSGLDLSQADLDLLLEVDPDAWRAETDLTGEYFEMFGDHMPDQLWREHDALVERLKNAG